MSVIGKIWEEVTNKDLTESGYYEYTEVRVLNEDAAFTMEEQFGRLNVFVDRDRRVTRICYDFEIFN